MLKKYFLPITLLLTCTALLTACGEEKSSAETIIRQTIATGEQLAEERKISGLKELIADTYMDEKKLDKKMVLRLLQGYFLGHQNIHLFTYIKDIQLLDDSQAQVILYVAMTGKPVTDLDSLMNIRAELYQFELSMIKDDDNWLVNRASWRRALPAELLDIK